jgi:hypothetical protein
MGRLGNDRIAETVAQRPDRLVGLGSVPMQDTALACLELERCVNDLKLKGVITSSHVNGIELITAPWCGLRAGFRGPSRTPAHTLRQLTTLTLAGRRGCRLASPAAE